MLPKPSIRFPGTLLSAGPFFVALGAITLFAVWDYPTGTAVRMGPGYWPRLLGFLLVGLGALVWLAGSRHSEEAPAPTSLRPVAMISASIVAFALTAEPLGLIAAIALAVSFAAFARTGPRLFEVAALTIGLVVFSALLFVRVLGVSLPLLPNW